MDNRTVNIEYVPQREFDIYIQNIRERADSDKELTAERFDKFEAVVDKKISELSGEVKRLDVKIDKVEDFLSTAIAGVVDRLDDIKEYQNKWFTVFGILFTVITVAFSVVAFFK